MPRCATALAHPIGAAPLPRARARPQERLHPDLRHHPAGAQPAVPAADDRRPARRRAFRWSASPSSSQPACIGPTRARSSPNSSAIPGCFDNVRVVNHFARDEAAHVDLGVTATRGTPVKLDRRFVEADLRIATGLVEPHFMAGWSGGRKVIAPGVAHARDHPHLPFRALHGRPAGGPVQSRRQSAARGAARDRPHARARSTRSIP